MKENIRKSKSLARLKKEVKEFNRKYPIGTEVLLKKDEFLLKKDFVKDLFKTKTRSEAFILGGHSPVVFLEDVSGCYHIECVYSLFLQCSWDWTILPL